MNSISHICLKHTSNAKEALLSLGLNPQYCEEVFSNSSQGEQARVRKFPGLSDYTITPHRIGDIAPFLKSAVNTHYMYSTCPASGKSLRSNISFPLLHRGWPYIFYKFCSDYDFYLIVGAHAGVRWFMYIPDLCATVTSESKHPPANPKNIKTLISEFNSLADIYANDMSMYCKNSQPRKTSIITHYSPHITFSVSADCASVFYISSVVKSADDYVFLNLGSKFLNRTDYCCDAISEFEVTRDSKELFKFSMENNLFVLQPTSNRLSKQFCESLVAKCRLAFESSKNHEHNKILAMLAGSSSPKLLINLRTDRRVWIDQKESLSWIVKKLKDMYSDLIIVFDGYTANRDGELSDESLDIVDHQKELALSIAHSASLENFVMLVGRSFDYKFAVASYCNIYLFGFGAGAILPYIVSLPGVVHSSADHAIANKIEIIARDFREDNPIPRVVSSNNLSSSDINWSRITNNTDLANTPFYNEDYCVDRMKVLDAILKTWEEISKE